MCFTVSEKMNSICRGGYPKFNTQLWEEDEEDSEETRAWRKSGLALRKASYETLLEVSYLVQNELLDYIQDLNRKKERKEFVGTVGGELLEGWMDLIKRVIPRQPIKEEERERYLTSGLLRGVPKKESGKIEKAKKEGGKEPNSRSW